VTRQRLRCAAAFLALALAGCGGKTADDELAPAGTAPSSTTVPATTLPAPTPTSLPLTAPTSTTRPVSVASTSPTPSTIRPAPVAPGPEYTQRDGLVLIEAVASGDPRALLRDLEALGLRDGVVVGRVVNGWLPVAAFASAQRLATLQFVQPTGAGTG
jgi:hypothetical protein